MIVGGGFMAYHLQIVYAIPIGYLGLVLLLSVEGVIIDPKTKKMNRYFSFLLFKSSDWVYIGQYQKLVLRLHREAHEVNMRSITNNIRTKTFEIHLSNEKGDDLYVTEYTDYESAHETVNQLSEALELPIEDQYQVMLDQLAERRRSMENNR